MLIFETCTHSRRANKIEKKNIKKDCKPGSTYCGISHSFTRCYLVLYQNKNEIPKINWEIFKSNNKVISFQKRVDSFKINEKFFENWQCGHRSNI